MTSKSVSKPWYHSGVQLNKKNKTINPLVSDQEAPGTANYVNVVHHDKVHERI